MLDEPQPLGGYLLKRSKVKIKLFYLCIVAIVISSCSPVPTNVSYPDRIVTPSVYPTFVYLPTLTATPVTPTATVESPPPSTATNSEFIEPEPDVYVSVLPAVLKYFYYRKQAIISRNVEGIWEEYPELRTDTDNLKGINAEGFLVSVYQGLKLLDGNIFPEYYDRMKVKIQGDEMEVLLHGMELYLFQDPYQQFSDSGGEFKIILFLRMKDGVWDVFKTDEVMPAEWHEFSP